MGVNTVKIITRDIWGAKPNKKSFSKLGEVKGLVVHWSAYPTAVGNMAEMDQVKKIQALHQNDRGWNDVAYNFLVGDTGQIYEGRGFGNRSAAQGGNNREEINYNNKHYVAVCWLGGRNATDKPSDKAIAAVRWLYEQVGGELRPHSSFKQTQCPGDAWRQHIVEKLSTPITNKAPAAVYIPNSFEDKVDEILVILKDIQKKLKLGKLIQ
jgi:hypothetical protein